MAQNRERGPDMAGTQIGPALGRAAASVANLGGLVPR